MGCGCGHIMETSSEQWLEHNFTIYWLFRTFAMKMRPLAVWHVAVLPNIPTDQKPSRKKNKINPLLLFLLLLKVSAIGFRHMDIVIFVIVGAGSQPLRFTTNGYRIFAILLLCCHNKQYSMAIRMTYENVVTIRY